MTEHTGPSPAYRALAARSAAQLEAIFQGGDTPAWDGLVGYEYRGYNHPPFMNLLGIRKFIKAFFCNAAGTRFGCNTPVRQDGLAHPWIARPSDRQPKRYAFFRVAPVNPAARDNTYLHALLLDYGRGGNPRADPSGLLRDYLVRVEPGTDDLLLGKAYLALGLLRVASNFFLLERLRPLPDAPQLRTHGAALRRMQRP